VEKHRKVLASQARRSLESTMSRHHRQSRYNLFLLVAVVLGCIISTCFAFVHNRAQGQRSFLSAVQIEDHKTRQQTPFEQQQHPQKATKQKQKKNHDQESAVAQLDELLQRTPSDQLDLPEELEICCENEKQESVKAKSEDNEQPKSSDNAQRESTSSTPDGNVYDDELEMQERRKAAARAALLGSRTQSPTSSATRNSGATTKRTSSNTSTSVGVRRVGSASIARQAPGLTKRILDAVRKSAVSSPDHKESRQGTDEEPPSSASMTARKPRISPSEIHDAVIELLERQRDEYLTAESHSIQDHTLGFFPSKPPVLRFSSTPLPGTILIAPSPSLRVDGDSNKLMFPDCLTVRVATPRCDTEVAHLRLSVFSDFSPDVRRQLVSRSVTAVESRRSLGATCLTATVPPSLTARKRNRPPIVLGSAECSYHEFDGTCLGRCRPSGSLLYITEVAVSPNARRRGIGAKLLEV
jgi:Acetyltransferase (GNAT) family